MDVIKAEPEMITFSDMTSSPYPAVISRLLHWELLMTWLHSHRLIWGWTVLVLFLPWYCKAITRESKPIVCPGRTISNDISEMSRLRNCNIIEGNLELLLITKGANWDSVVLPELREITGMLVLYRVYDLHSLGHLLPKLSVIRGDDTLMGYSLVVYQAIHLERLGLTQLTTIQNGSVRIQDNPHLCYVTTVKWRRIILSDEEEKIERNGDACLDCPRSCGVDVGCWGPDECQRVAAPSCPHSSYDEKTCCDPSCLGGCSAPHSSRACFACVGLLSSDSCVDTCYINEYKYQNRRCVSETECRDADPKNKILRADSSKGYEAECVRQCPGKMDVRGTSTFCEPCKDDEVCEKICPGQYVNTIEEAKAFEGCTKIDGVLQLSISGGKDITTDLTKYFQDIREVTHYIHIFHSAFLSLEFFRSLRVIEGKELENDKYALYVRDNKVLEDIWDWPSNRSFTIMNGSVFFHSNPKLCHGKIEELLNRTNCVNNCSESAIKLNGGNAACRVNDLRADVEAVPNRRGELKVTWDQVTIPDARALLGYNVYYRTTEFRNLTIYNNRDACNEPWEMKYVENKDNDNENGRMSLLLTNLVPNTLYAVYVETDIILSTDTGARSNIMYCLTDPFNPGHPQKVRLRSNDNAELEVTWEPPLDPNGEIKVYLLHATVVVPRPTFTEDDRFCDKPLRHWRELEEMHTTDVRETVEDELHQPQPPRDEDCCSCKSQPQDYEETRREKITSKLFEEALYQLVYSSDNSTGHRRHRRSTNFKDDVNELSNPEEIELTLDEGLIPGVELRNGNETLVLVSANKRKYQFKDFEPFKQYRIEIVACQGIRDCPGKTGKCRLCSRKPYLQRRIYTKGKVDADNVLRASVNLTSESQGQVSFMPPENPLSPLVGFLVHCFSLDVLSRLDCCEFRRVSECANNTCIVDLPATGPGTFNVSIMTVSNYRIGQNVSLTYHIKNKDGMPWVPVVLALLLALAVMAATVTIWRRKQSVTKPPYVLSHVAPNPMYLRLRELYDKIEEKYIHLPNNLKIYENDREGVLGKGNFGVVKRGNLRLIKDGGQGNDYEEVPVAVKQVTTYLGNKSALEEAALMLKFKCFHLVRLYGVVPDKDTVYLVMELMKGGDLKQYLKSLPVIGGSIFSTLSLEKVHAMAVQIADGMAYLAAKKMVHRDLAARNCLLDEKLNVKISDFGMTRIADNEYYRMNNSTLLPMRWMPPESLREFYFTSQSDVWSYGVVVWEILTGGARPYENMNEREVSDYVKRGNTLESSLPDDTPPYLASLLVQCWQFYEHKRPNFFQIVASLEPYTSPLFQKHFRLVSFYNSTECDEFWHHLYMDGVSAYSTSTIGYDNTTMSNIKQKLDDE